MGDGCVDAVYTESVIVRNAEEHNWRGTEKNEQKGSSVRPCDLNMAFASLNVERKETRSNIAFRSLWFFEGTNPLRKGLRYSGESAWRVYL